MIEAPLRMVDIAASVLLAGALVIDVVSVLDEITGLVLDKSPVVGTAIVTVLLVGSMVDTGGVAPNKLAIKN